MATIPDREEHRRRFGSLDAVERRSIVKAVNRGEAVEKRKLAPLAVGIARRQLRFWKWAWLVAPAMGGVQIYFIPPEVVLLNTLVATLTLGGMSFYFYRRASRAETRNLAFAAGPSSAGNRNPGRASGFGRHLPGEASGTTEHTPDELDGGGPADPPGQPGHKPYKPRGRKRR